MNRKNGQRSKFDALTQEQRGQLIDWLVAERISYPEALRRVAEKFGVHSSNAAMSKFYQRECLPRLLREHALKGAYLQITVKVRQGDTIIGETELAVALNAPAAPIRQTGGAAAIAFDVSTKSPSAKREGKCNS